MGVGANIPFFSKQGLSKQGPAQVRLLLLWTGVATQSCFVRPAERPLNDGRAAARREVRVGWVGRIKHPQKAVCSQSYTLRNKSPLVPTMGTNVGWAGGKNAMYDSRFGQQAVHTQC